jgi:hypothetical protein
LFGRFAVYGGATGTLKKALLPHRTTQAARNARAVHVRIIKLCAINVRVKAGQIIAKRGHFGRVPENVVRNLCHSEIKMLAQEEIC